MAIQEEHVVKKVYEKEIQEGNLKEKVIDAKEFNSKLNSVLADIDDDHMTLVKAFSLDDGTELDVKADGDRFALTPHDALSLLVNEVGLPVLQENGDICVIAFIIKKEDFPEDIFFEEKLPAFGYKMYGIEREVKLLGDFHLDELEYEVNDKSGLVTINNYEITSIK